MRCKQKNQNGQKKLDLGLDESKIFHFSLLSFIRNKNINKQKYGLSTEEDSLHIQPRVRGCSFGLTWLWLKRCMQTEKQGSFMRFKMGINNSKLYLQEVCGMYNVILVLLHTQIWAEGVREIHSSIAELRPSYPCLSCSVSLHMFILAILPWLANI